MIAFSLLPAPWRLILCGVLFLTAMGALLLGLYRYVSTGKLRRCIPDLLLFSVLLLLLPFYAVPLHLLSKGTPADLPWGTVAAVAAAVSAWVLFSGVRIYGNRKRSLSPASILQALDDLTFGIFFADRAGKILLVNRTMREVCHVLLQTYPQTAEEVYDALERCCAEETVERVDPAFPLYRFPDGRILRFSSVTLAGDGVDGYTQTTAQDVTELYRETLALQESNETLRRTNGELRRMYERLADRIREQETLHLRMRIHNELGSGLIALSRLLDGQTDDVQTPLACFQSAAGYFSPRSVDLASAWDNAVLRAARMGVFLRLEGKLPSGEEPLRLTVAAAEECVTNCIRHAGGDRVDVRIERTPEGETVRLTNNGAPPAGPIREGGGLSALRAGVEAAGGTMTLSCDGAFLLTLRFLNQEENR